MVRVACAAGEGEKDDEEDRRDVRCRVSVEAVAAGEAGEAGVLAAAPPAVPSSSEEVRSRELMRNERGLAVGVVGRKEAFLASGGAGKFFLRSTCVCRGEEAK